LLMITPIRNRSDKNLRNHSRFTTFNFSQSPQENRSSTVKMSRFLSSLPGANLLGDLLFVCIFSPTLDDGRVFESHDVKREIRRTPRGCRRIRRAVDRTSYATHEWYTPRESFWTTYASFAFIYRIRRPAARGPPSPRAVFARAPTRALLLSPLLLRPPAERAVNLRSKKLIEEGKEEEKHICTGVQSCRSCHSRPGRARCPVA